MTDRAEVFYAALNSLPEGIVLFGGESEIVLWNEAAERITGYAAMELMGRQIPESLDALMPGIKSTHDATPDGAHADDLRALMPLRHKYGQTVSVIARTRVLRDDTGRRIGTAAIFHPVESVDALPHRDSAPGRGVEEGRADLEERMQNAMEDYARGGPQVGVLCLTVDQAEELRKSRGAGACQSMFDKVRHAIAQGLRPSEVLGRWDEDEFLIITHERNVEALVAHMQTLVGLARTADFRWWGDRLSLTVSIGAAQAVPCACDEEAESLAQLLQRAHQAMEAALQAGGNRALIAPGRPLCSPS